MNKIGFEDILPAFSSSKSGYIDLCELSKALPELTADDLDQLLHELDVDGDGRISIQELESKFNEYSQDVYGLANDENSSQTKSNQKLPLDKRPSNGLTRSRSASDIQAMFPLERTVSYMTDDDKFHPSLYRRNSTIELFKSLESHNEAFQVYCHLAQEDETILKKFEIFLEDAIKTIKEKTVEKESLEKLYIDEKKKQKVHLNSLEEEANSMTKKIEQRLLQQLESKFDSERSKYEDEILELRERLEKERNAEQENKLKAQSELIQIRHNLSEMEKSLRKLEHEKLEAETKASMARSQLAALKQNFELHLAEKAKGTDIVLDYMKDEANLLRQVKNLQEANKHLLDLNADLKGEVALLQKKERETSHKDADSLLISLQKDICKQAEITSVNESNEEPGGNNSLPLSVELEAACISSSFNGAPDSEGPAEHTNYITATAQEENSASEDYHGEMTTTSLESETNGRTSISSSPIILTRRHDIHSSPDIKLRSNDQKHSLNRKSSAFTELSIDDMPQQVFKIVLAGEASVGKSSFVLQLCKGVFQQNNTSTVGIDCYTKNVEIDSYKVTLQLWDTAGQERFRSITASYFRRADGVILLYDCCADWTFVKVREWVSTIREITDRSHEHDIPIMICANKTDLRSQSERDGVKVISSSTGKQVSEDCHAMFCEISAKTGDRIYTAIEQLARAMKAREDKVSYEHSSKIQLSKQMKKKDCC